jgi:hypothetical protein
MSSTTTLDDSEDLPQHRVLPDSRATEAAKQLLCGGMAGAVAKTLTAPFSRLTILFQVHSMVTTKEHRPKFAMSLRGGVDKIIERGGVRALWRGNMTSVLHRFPYSAINFAVYEHTLDLLTERQQQQRHDPHETTAQLVRRMTKIVMPAQHDEESSQQHHPPSNHADTTKPLHKFIAGAVAGTTACLACYPLDLVRTRLTTELEGHEHYQGIRDAFRKVYQTEGLKGFYSGVGPTLLVAVPNFAISYTVYGTLKEYTLDDDLFYNLRRIDADSGEPKLGFWLTVGCGAWSGILATLVTFPMDTIRRRMQIQSLHVPAEQRMTSYQQLHSLIMKEGLVSLYRGLTPEILKVIPMVGTMFTVYEFAKDHLNV